MHRDNRHDHSRGWRLTHKPCYLVRLDRAHPKPHEVLLASSRRDEQQSSTTRAVWQDIKLSHTATYFLLLATPIYIFSTIISFALWPFIKGNVPLYDCKRNILWDQDSPSSETAVSHYTRRNIMFQECGINNRTQKITSPASYPSSLLFPAVSSWGWCELLSIRDRVKVIWRKSTCGNKSY